MTANSGKLRQIWTLLRPSEFALALESCPNCGKSLFVKLADDEKAIRCLRCSGTPVHLSVIQAISCELSDAGSLHAYEMSSRGPLVKFLRRQFKHVETSEFFDGVVSGTQVNGVRCEDVQALSFPDHSFDLCSSTEVFEHVPDDAKGFREVYRVLRPGGRLIFTVPIQGMSPTVERAVIHDGQVQHLLPPMFHGDRIRGSNQVLVFRDYGLDICSRIRAAGFAEARLFHPSRAPFGLSRIAVIAAK